MEEILSSDKKLSLYHDLIFFSDLKAAPFSSQADNMQSPTGSEATVKCLQRRSLVFSNVKTDVLMALSLSIKLDTLRYLLHVQCVKNSGVRLVKRNINLISESYLTWPATFPQVLSTSINIVYAAAFSISSASSGHCLI